MLRNAAIAAGRAAQPARAALAVSIVAELLVAGASSLSVLAKGRGLNERGIPTARGPSAWQPIHVTRLLKAGLVGAVEKGEPALLG